MDWNVPSPTKLYVEALIPSVMVLEVGFGEAIRVRWAHEGGDSW